MFKKINTKWMALEPAQQYLYWIISLAFSMGFSIFTLIISSEFIMASGNISLVVTSGIGLFFLWFISVVMFLTIHWPHKYKVFKEKK